MTSQSSSPWATGRLCRSGPFPRRSLEIGAIVVGFIYWWPIGLALVAWKFAGYPAFAELRDAARRTVSEFDGGRPASRFARAFEAANRRGGTGNAAFDEYRRAELDRLEAQRRALEEESRAFSDFVEELKRARDREQFDAFMAKRRNEGGSRSV
ncbi:hypothetical protein ABID82_006695 [Methylobacterium sp. PvP062]|uniref:DUF2852 domain-containing protein n=2 Tax=Methylobacterium radiotolerans TaxID=31998 RepID=B1M4R1_METRJ|nr:MULTISPECIES: DUF2852 domain-containing protein [Methylobacterium]MCX7335362.1 DUF2852 domain-containing protein [Hyphomicrobiales bacterium]GAN51057.1 hypothetical protein ME121_5120 [Methylobacterium sp. ME121]ACB24957.1 conserved hypothetical protein [Methylobacterium radiotolerans JCM 2831]KIU32473.1 membrane protein [Methylobacterium radiotolerans]KTS12478.1 membrane protein [Methylobacterium radiotolerans]